MGEELLTPHRNYSASILKVLEKYEIKGLAHITGGGFLGNIPRILSEGTAAEIIKGSWPILPIFSLIQKLGQIEELEMHRVFNMGIGMAVVVSPEIADKVSSEFQNLGEQV